MVSRTVLHVVLVAAFLAAGTMVVPGTAVGDILIDDFSSKAASPTWAMPGGFTFSNGATFWNITVNGALGAPPNPLGTGTVGEGPSVANVLGGFRNAGLTINTNAAAGPFAATLTLNNTFGGGVLDLATASAVNADVHLGYPGGIGGLNWSASGVSSINLGFNFLDVGMMPPMPVTIDLTDDDGTVFSLTVPVFGSPVPMTVAFPLSAFTGVGVFNFGEIDDILIHFNEGANASADFQLAQITASQVPEPASVAAWCLIGLVGLVGLVGLRGLRRGK